MSNEKQQGKHHLLKLLEGEGVEVMFGNPGSTELAVMDALAVSNSIRYVLSLHEAVAMAMACGYSVATGKLCAVNLHAAPGLGNAMGMLYNAKKAGAPVLVTAGNQDTTIALTEPILWDDLAVMARPLVKWSYEVQRLADLPRAIQRAAKVAMTPPTGPVFLSIPGDLLTETADLKWGTPTRIGAGIRGDRNDIERAAKMIAASERPLIMAGDIVAKREAYAELIVFAELIGAPVYMESMADTASFPSSHPQFAGVIPRFSPAMRTVTAAHDLIVSVGGDLFTQSLATGLDVFEVGTKIIHIDVDPWELGKNYSADVALLADPKEGLPELTDAIRRAYDGSPPAHVAQRNHETRAAIVAGREQRRKEATTKLQNSPMDSTSALHVIGARLPQDAIVCEELLSSNRNLRDFIRTELPDSFYGMRGGGIGMGLPQAVGAKIGLPHRPVVALVGDGSSLYSFQALWTAAHERLAMVFVIFNNRSYHILKQRTLALGGHSKELGRFVAMDLNDPAVDFVALSQSLGVSACQVDTAAALDAALEEALNSGAPRLIEVMIKSTL